MTRPLRRELALVAAFALTAAAARPAAAEEELEPPPTRAEPAPKPDLPSPATRWNLALTGVGVTAGFYGAALGASLLWSNGAWAPDMRIPIAGPWMALPDLKCGSGEINCGTALVVIRGILAGIDGIGQAGGLLIALESVFLPVRAEARAKTSSSRKLAKGARVMPVPFVAGRDGIGLGLVGEL